MYRLKLNIISIDKLLNNIILISLLYLQFAAKHLMHHHKTSNFADTFQESIN